MSSTTIKRESHKARGIRVENLTYSTIKLLGLGLGFITSLVLARLGSLELVGYYALLLAVVNLGTVFTNLGLNPIIVRELAAGPNFAPARLVARCNTRKAIAVGGLVIAAMLLHFAGGWDPVPGYSPALILTAPAAIIFLNVLADSYTASLLAQGKQFPSQFISLVLKPVLTLAVVTIACTTTGVDALKLILLGMVGVSAATTLILFLANYRLPGYRQGIGQALPAGLLATGSSLLGAQLMSTLLVNAGVLLLTWLVSTEAAGAYHICLKLAAIANVSLMMSNTIKAPLYARLYREHRINELKTTVKGISRDITLLTLGFAVPMMLAGNWLLGIWNTYYSNYASSLAILLLAYLIDAAFGPGGRLLVMTSRERIYSRSVMVVGTASLALGTLLVSRYGVTGAALSYLIWITTLNLVWAWLLKRQLGFTPLLSLSRPAPYQASNG